MGLYRLRHKALDSSRTYNRQSNEGIKFKAYMYIIIQCCQIYISIRIS